MAKMFVGFSSWRLTPLSSRKSLSSSALSFGSARSSSFSTSTTSPLGRALRTITRYFLACWFSASARAQAALPKTTRQAKSIVQPPTQDLRISHLGICRRIASPRLGLEGHDDADDQAEEGVPLDQSGDRDHDAPDVAGHFRPPRPALPRRRAHA